MKLYVGTLQYVWLIMSSFEERIFASFRFSQIQNLERYMEKLFILVSNHNWAWNWKNFSFVVKRF
jgi:hypothetical protein